jgi:hypothetical protein
MIAQPREVKPELELLLRLLGVRHIDLTDYAK